MVFSFAALVLSAAFPVQSIADGGCSPIFNGGTTTQQYCPTPTVLPTPAPFNEYIPPQTAGGQKIYPVTQTKNTPDTGPNDWSLPTLFLLGGLGILFLKMSKTAKI
jgi:hypothetical protein